MIVGVSGLSAQNMYRLLNTEEGYERQLDLYKNDPQVDRAIERFTTKVYEFTTVDELLEDYEARHFLAQAYNIEGDVVDSVAFIKRILTDDLSAEDALVYRMNDQRFIKMASDLRLDQGLLDLRNPVYLAQIQNQYYEVGLEQAMGDQNLAVREAMYFKRTAGEITNAYQILADNALRAVVFGELQIPPEVAYQDVDKQAALITERLNLEDFQDPDYVDDFVMRYLLRQDAASFDATSGMASLVQPLVFDDSGVLSNPIYSLDVNLIV